MVSDPLSDVLRMVRLTGGVFLEGNLTAPWSFTSAVTPEDCAPFIAETRQLVAYHLIVDGQVFVSVGGAPALRAGAGELIVLPRNDVHVISSAPGLTPIRTDDLVLPAGEGQLARVDFGGGGDATVLYCGFLASEEHFNPVIAALPSILKLDMNRSATFDLIEASMRFACQELLKGKLASSNTLSRLSELLFVEAVRNYSASDGAEGGGWLSGFKDPQIGRALAALHGNLRQDWTAEQLAQQAGMSRTAFVNRFNGVVGMPPIRYLTSWRLRSAQMRLRDTGDTIARIAEATGYDSEEAFSRAFKRAFGLAPTHWRSSQATGTGVQ